MDPTWRSQVPAIAERRWGTFARSFVLPRDVDAENIQAGFEDGVLTVRIPNSEKARRRKIDIGGTAQTQELGSSSVDNGKQQNG
ncbi:MAG TPA: Hsp20/alpha crystallin family protein [Longimicrobium sp.]|nr:Hsp20/alpha crystallin family protein [Longimicrobium sp.]